MTKITEAKEKMKLKLGFEDYPLAEKRKSGARKIYAISKKEMRKLEEIFQKRIQLKKQATIAEIMGEAIDFLYRKEVSS